MRTSKYSEQQITGLLNQATAVTASPRLPLPIEGELYVGHVGRLRRWLHEADYYSTLGRVISRMASRTGRWATGVEAVAVECNLDPPVYFAKHTMLPFIRFVMPTTKQEPDPPPIWSIETVKKLARTTPEPHAVFCHLCAMEQRDQRSFSVWLRVHQLPTNLTCAVHQVPLYVTQRSDAFMEQPASIYQSGDWQQREVPDHWRDSSGVQHLHQMCLAMLGSHRCTTESKLRAAVCARAQEIAPTNAPRRAGLRISDSALAQLDSYFIAEFSTALGNHSGWLDTKWADLAGLDDYLRFPVALALLLTLLYESPSEAVAACLTS